MSGRLPVLYLAPWVGYGGSDKNTIDWFRWIDRDRFAPSLIATQPSPNPLLDQIEPYAEEIWVLPDLMPANEMPAFILEFVASRGIAAIHLMNSKLGFDLLPELAALPEAPAVVVQMHAEEADRSGYVRYVTTRSADLVDCFSLSNEPVADAVREYGVPEDKVRVIYTGVDADGEFDPDRAMPARRLDPSKLQILFAARLVAQKDPLLMVEVARALRDEEVEFQIHVVGEGDMEEEIEARVEELELGDRVVLHGPSAGLRDWYAACDVLLLTSTFEGIPVVIFEAMSMGLPIVTAGLPAISGLLGSEEEGVILPRDSVPGYVESLARLARDREHLAARGGAMRTRAKRQLSVQQMAAEHGALYAELVAARGLDGEAPGLPSSDAELPIVGVGGGDLEELRGRLAATGTPIVGLTTGSPAALHDADPALAAKVLRRFAADETLDAIALTDARDEARFSFRALPRDDGPAKPVPHTVIWRRSFERRLPSGLRVNPWSAVASLAWLFSAAGARLEWRHLANPGGAAAEGLGSPEGWKLLADDPPADPVDPPPRDVWTPPRSRLLVRYRHPGGDRVVTSAEPPPGYRREHVLGALRDAPYRGTVELVSGSGSYRVREPEEDGEIAGADGLGYLEAAPLPGLDSVALATIRASGEVLPISLPEDPLLPEVDVGEHLGFLDPQPLRPRETPSAERDTGLVGLTTAVDAAARRHRCAIGSLPAGELVGELGSVSASGLGGSIPAWVVDGRLVTDSHRPANRGPRWTAAARWTAEPLRWGDLAPWQERAKVAARRGVIAAKRVLRPSPEPAQPARPADGWLFEWDGPGMVPLFAAYHPVTGDQLLTRHPENAAELGYEGATRLGFMRATPSLCDALGEIALPIPWARRFGHVPRSA